MILHIPWPWNFSPLITVCVFNHHWYIDRLKTQNFPNFTNALGLFRNMVVGLKIKLFERLIIHFYSLISQIWPKSRVESPQCGNLIISLPVWFYVKSISGNLEFHKLPFWQFQNAWMWIFSKCQSLKSAKSTQNVNSKLLKLSNRQSFESLNLPKLISRKMRVTVKFFNFSTMFC